MRAIVRVTTPAAALALAITWVEYSGAQEKQSNATQQTPKDRDPPPGAENIDRKAERAQNTAPILEGQGQNWAAAQPQNPAN